MNARALESALLELEYQTGEDGEPIIEKLARATSFEDAGILTNNRGVVFRMKDGSEFQITIVQSAPPSQGETDNDEDEEGGQ